MRRCSQSAPTSFVSPWLTTPRVTNTGAGLPGPNGWKRFRSRRNARGDVREEEFAVDLHLGLQRYRVDVLFDVGIEAAGELLDPFGTHRESCCVHVPAEVLQQVRTGFDCLIEVEAGHRAGRTP